jgi:hypothetical protein
VAEDNKATGSMSSDSHRPGSMRAAVSCSLTRDVLLPFRLYLRRPGQRRRREARGSDPSCGHSIFSFMSLNLMHVCGAPSARQVGHGVAYARGCERRVPDRITGE